METPQQPPDPPPIAVPGVGAPADGSTPSGSATDGGHPRAWPESVPELLREGRVGNWRWPWALAGTLCLVPLILGAALLAGRIEDVVAWQLAGNPPTEAELLPGRLDTYAGFLLFAAGLVLPVVLVVRGIHHQRARHLLGQSGRFAWPLFWRAAGGFLLVLSAMSLVTALTEPEMIVIVPDLLPRLPWMLLALPVIFCQAFAEDYLFKGYLVRTWGAVVPVPWIVVPAIAAFFTAGHAINDDVMTDLAFNLLAFFAGEVVIMAIYLRSGNLAVATGLHWMNNVWSMCLVATLPGQSAAIAIATYTDPDIAAGRSHITDPIAYLEVIALYALLWFVLMHPRSPFAVVRETATDERRGADGS